MNNENVLRRRLRRGQKSRIVTTAILIPIVIIWLLPLLWGLATSFKTDTDIDAHLLSLIPRDFTLERYIRLFENSDLYPVLRWLFNSVYIAAAYTVLHLLVLSLAAYAFSVLEFKGRNVLFTAVLSTMMIPGVINLVPMYNMMVRFNWVGSPLALIVPGVAGVSGLFIMRQFFMNIPKSLVESAQLEGAGHFSIFFRIVLPLSSSALMVTGLFGFLANWNDYMWPQIILGAERVTSMTLTVGLSQMQGSYNYDLGLTMTAAILSAVPVLLLFLVTQEKVIEGIAHTGLK